MALKSVVEDITTVAEAFRGEYEERDGKYVLSVEDVDSHPAVSGLKSAFGKTKEEISALKAKYRDVDPVKYAALMEQERKQQSEGAGSDPEKIRKLVESEFAPKLTAAEQRAEEYQRKFQGIAKTDRVRQAALKAGVIAEDLDDVISLTSGNFELDEATMKIIVRDTDGNPTGETVDQYFSTTFKNKRPKFYVASMGGGSGAPGSGGSGQGGSGPIRLTKAQANDVQTYRRAREQAQKSGRDLVIDG